MRFLPQTQVKPYGLVEAISAQVLKRPQAGCDFHCYGDELADRITRDNIRGSGNAFIAHFIGGAVQLEVGKAGYGLVHGEY